MGGDGNSAVLLDFFQYLSYLQADFFCPDSPYLPDCSDVIEKTFELFRPGTRLEDTQKMTAPGGNFNPGENMEALLFGDFPHPVDRPESIMVGDGDCLQTGG